MNDTQKDHMIRFEEKRNELPLFSTWWVFDHKFVKKYIDDITDIDVIYRILSDETLPDHLRVYLKMKFEL